MSGEQWLRGAIGVLSCLAASGCRQADAPPREASGPSQAASEQAPQASTEPGARERPAFDWSPYVGRCVVAEGYASGAKIGPRLHGGAWSIGVALTEPPGDEAWWALPSGGRVRVRGVVSERADLPVFVQKEGEPVMQGIPVPEGTDLDAARRRYVLEQASVTLVRTVAQVEAELAARLGQETRLDGVVWSVNGRFWFNHDGVNIHLQGQEGVPGWKDMHGRTITLRGRLERRRLPRIDQIVVKPNPDLADAFLLHVREVATHPDWAVADCSKAR